MLYMEVDELQSGISLVAYSILQSYIIIATEFRLNSGSTLHIIQYPTEKRSVALIALHQ